MSVEFINPFLAATHDVLNTMVSMDARPGKPSLKKETESHGDVSGFAPMEGPQLKGSIALTFKKTVIFEVVKRLFNENVQEINPDVKDAVGEFTNMVMGYAKNTLNQQSYDFELSIPDIVYGENHNIIHTVSAPTIILPLQTDYGDIFIEICFSQITD